MPPIEPTTYTLPRRLAVVRIWRRASATERIGRFRAAAMALRAAATSQRRRTVTVNARRA